MSARIIALQNEMRQCVQYDEPGDEPDCWDAVKPRSVLLRHNFTNNFPDVHEAARPRFLRQSAKMSGEPLLVPLIAHMKSLVADVAKMTSEARPCLTNKTPENFGAKT